MLARLNGEDGLAQSFPAMVNAVEVMTILGYAADDPRLVTAKRALRKLLVIGPTSAYCQPCVSPVWDTALTVRAMQEVGMQAALKAATRCSRLAQDEQLLDEPGDWRIDPPHLNGGGWAFQFANDDHPDLDDTAVVAWAMHQAPNADEYTESVSRALDWLAGMQSKNGGFAAFDADNTSYYLNKIPFADHGALLDPPTSDVSGRVVTALGLIDRPQDGPVLERAIAYLRAEQEPDGSWFGRWGTNYVYGTWSVLTAFAQAGVPADDPAVRRAVDWLITRQNSDGGWGETNDSYLKGGARPQSGEHPVSNRVGIAWPAGGGGSALRCRAPRGESSVAHPGAARPVERCDIHRTGVPARVLSRSITATAATSRSGRWPATAR